MVYGYLVQRSTTDVNCMIKAISRYAESHRLSINHIVNDQAISGSDWHAIHIGELIEHAEPGDTIICYDAPTMALSLTQLLEILQALLTKRIACHFVKYDMVYSAAVTSSVEEIVALFKVIETDYLYQRAQSSVKSRKVSGRSIERPKGQKNRKLKLDVHRATIQHYLDLNVSKISIAKLIGCHAQTLYNYIKARGLAPKPSDGSKESITKMRKANTQAEFV